MTQENIIIKILGLIEQGYSHQDILTSFPAYQKEASEILKLIGAIDKEKESRYPSKELLIDTLEKSGVTNVDLIRKEIMSENYSKISSAEDKKSRSPQNIKINFYNTMKQKLKIFVPTGLAILVLLVIGIIVLVNKDDNGSNENSLSNSIENTSNQEAAEIDGLTVGEDIDEIVDSIIKISEDEKEVLESEYDDTAYIDADQTEINNLINSYDENEL